MMIHCKNCGQMNAEQSNFCRFCGRKFNALPPSTPSAPQRQREKSSEPKQPRPYSWKTDEFQIKQTGSARPTELINDVPIPFHGDNQKTRPLPAHRQQHGIAREYRCPHCGSHAIPYAVRKISNAGWIVFALLMVLFFPLFWVGFLIKEDAFICPECNFRVN